MSYTTKKIIAGNWKMNMKKSDGLNLIKSIKEASKAIDESKTEFIICPPFTLIDAASEELKGTNIGVGGQDCHNQTSGAYTGNISADMLKDLGVKFVILGHSERREYEKETSEYIAQKAETAIKASLIPIICVGENLQEREAGLELKVISEQFDKSIPTNEATADNIIIAYEPVWAIGTGKIPTLEDIEKIHNLIQEKSEERFKTKDINILYGGSVKPTNAKDILSLKNVSGALIGGASLKSEDFIAIAKASEEN